MGGEISNDDIVDFYDFDDYDNYNDDDYDDYNDHSDNEDNIDNREILFICSILQSSCMRKTCSKENLFCQRELCTGIFPFTALPANVLVGLVFIRVTKLTNTR